MNVFSEDVWLKPIKRKKAKVVTAAMKKVLPRMKQKPKHIQIDLGQEFYNKKFSALMVTLKIHHYSTFSTLKARHRRKSESNSEKPNVETVQFAGFQQMVRYSSDDRKRV